MKGGYNTMSKDIYVIAEQRDGVLAKVGKELIGEATKLISEKRL